MSKSISTSHSDEQSTADERFTADEQFTVALQDLDRWFDRQKRVLPWRNDPSFYRVWVSEIMLQQTQVVTVIPYFERFVASFPNVQALAQAELEEVLLLWSGLGYYSRARNLHRGAQQIWKQGGFPKTRESWLEIPGVGHYTAGAILSIADNQAEAILDGNVERVISRVRKVARENGDTLYKAMLWKLSKEWVEWGQRWKIRPSNLNQALMELGATVCTPRNPRCAACPLSAGCSAYRSKEQESYPPKKKPKEWTSVLEQLHCVVNQSGEVLLRRRREGEWRAGLWDLLEEQPGAGAGNIPILLGQIESRHIVTRHKIQRSTQVWRVRAGAAGAVGAAGAAGAAGAVGAELRWVELNPLETSKVPMGSALKKTLQQVALKFPGVLSR